ncbi:MAG TPA: S-adenosylmethionine:tRNA ribosyltransferase-isomerase, partial [Dissulfurispiraceae bacterium]|nr:S-adenosylmethionine:tRNA ribosyltransferase-isomerase [Dissulfurispiraceae bacterium]
QAIYDKGVLVRKITLHVGPGTFRPIITDVLSDHRMDSEHFEFDSSLVSEMQQVKESRRRVVAVGTTTTRAIEGFLSGAYRSSGNGHAPSPASGNGRVEGSTDVFIHPGYAFKAVDGLVTNFHLPRSTPLMLVAALAGRTKMLDAYREAIAMGYRFFSYGDAMLIL